MKIKKVECDQFAGLRNKELAFSDGLNLVVGENESGKSTVIDLIYQLLFKDVKLDRRSDSDFIEKYFPKRVNGRAGDVIDGALSFFTENGPYKLRKEWEKGEGTSRITLPDGTSIKSNQVINEILKEELKHRAGVFNEIVFASQKRQQIAIESIMRELSRKKDDFAQTREDLVSTLTKAALQTGGVSMDVLEKKLQERILLLEQHWDERADLPEGGVKRGINNPWKKEIGLILGAYYEMEAVRRAQNEAENAEKAVESLKSRLKTLQTNKEEKDAELKRFQDYRAVLGQISLHKQKVQDLRKSIAEYENVLVQWPVDRKNLEKAIRLKADREMAAVRALYDKAELAQREWDEKRAVLESLQAVDADDIWQLEELQKKQDRLERKIAGLNLVVKIRQLGEKPVEIRSAATGELLVPEKDEIRIREAVEIAVPGIMEMQLMPQGIDLDQVKQVNQELKEVSAQMRELFEKYQTDDLFELKNRERNYRSAKEAADQKKAEAERVFGDKTWEEIKRENSKVPEGIAPEAVIQAEISSLCGGKSIDVFIGGLERILADYQERYRTAQDLELMLGSAKTQLVGSREALQAAEDIPEEYRHIEDPEAYNKQLRGMIAETEETIDSIRDDIQAAEKKLGEKSAEEYSEELKERQSLWEAKKEELERWKSIRRVFLDMKEQTDDHPMEDIGQHFREYLNVITDGNLDLLSMDDQMSVRLSSKDHALTYDILSEGTRETISLAFRLAMLEHLYPEGDGLAIFDDPFTEMDPKRVRQACSLIQKFAEKNQVIFVTCDEKYKNLLDGNVISVE